MRILVATPISVTAIGGPAAIARLMKIELEAEGDVVTVATQNSFEKKLPPIARQAVLFVRAFFLCLKNDAVLLLDPVSTGISFALAARLTGRKTVLRIGGDFLWESYVERVKESVLLSEFYLTDRKLSLYENLIRKATYATLHLVDHIVFTTTWQQEIWKKPYNVEGKEMSIITNPMPSQQVSSGAGEKVFLAAARNSFMKNTQMLTEIWPSIVAEFPDVVLDTEARGPEEYQEALKNSYALLIPTFSEVSPNSMLEAIHYGKPFISTKDNGLYERYRDSGMFIDTRDAAAMRAAIRTLLTPEGYRQAIQAAGSKVTPVSTHEVALAFRQVLMG